MYETKKAADAHDKMLALAEQFALVVEQMCPQVDEAQSEALGLLLAKHSDVVVQACKGKPELLTALLEQDKVSPISGAAS